MISDSCYIVLRAIFALVFESHLRYFINAPFLLCILGNLLLIYTVFLNGEQVKLPMSLYKVQDLFGINPIYDGNYDPFTDSVIEETEDKVNILNTH